MAATDDITTTSGNVYTMSQLNGKAITRTHSSMSSLSAPKTLDISHDESKTSARHLVKLSQSKVSTEGLKGTVSVHIVITDKDPNGILTSSDRTAIYAELATLATSAKLALLEKGNLAI